jgi:hypothetical protein
MTLIMRFHFIAVGRTAFAALIFAHFIVSSKNAALASVSFNGHELPGVTEIYRSSIVQPTRIDVSRNRRMATVLTLRPSPGSNIYSLLQFSPNEGLRTFTLPNGRSIGWVSWSNAGAAIYAQTDNNVYYVPWSQAAATIFDQFAVNIGGPAINDTGSITLASREAASHPLRDEWLSTAGQPAALLPDLDEYRLSNEIAIDGADRVVGTFEFRNVSPVTQKVMRYDFASGWETLVDNTSNTVLVGIIGGQPINSRGDFIFASTQGTPTGVEYWLNLFDTTANTTRSLTQYNGDIQTVRATIADTGDAMITLRTPYDLNVFRYEADNGTVTDLSTILSTGQALILQRLPRMNHKGEMVFGTWSNDGTAYFSLDEQGGRLESITSLKGLDLQEYALSDSGQVYFRLSNLNESLVGMVTIPEPATTSLGFLAICGLVNLRHGRD